MLPVFFDTDITISSIRTRYIGSRIRWRIDLGKLAIGKRANLAWVEAALLCDLTVANQHSRGRAQPEQDR